MTLFLASFGTWRRTHMFATLLRTQALTSSVPYATYVCLLWRIRT